jgi:cell fate (sporulation/competence/biofilm development) regulator YlbF (YheA/YmcA/DUF963 family)
MNNAATTVEDISDDVEILRGMAQDLDDMLASTETVENVADAFAEIKDVAAKAQELAEACQKLIRAHAVKARAR